MPWSRSPRYPLLVDPLPARLAVVELGGGRTTGLVLRADGSDLPCQHGVSTRASPTEPAQLPAMRSRTIARSRRAHASGPTALQFLLGCLRPRARCPATNSARETRRRGAGASAGRLAGAVMVHPCLQVPRTTPEQQRCPSASPEMDSYKSTACRRSSSEHFLRAMVLDHLHSPSTNVQDAEVLDSSVTKNQGQARSTPSPDPAPPEVARRDHPMTVNSQRQR